LHPSLYWMWAIQFKLGLRATEWIVVQFKLGGPGIWPPILNQSTIHSGDQRPILNWMAASNVNLDATIWASIAGSVTPGP
jgi:hypothetical protein